MMTVPMDSASVAPSSARDLAERLLTRVKPLSSFFVPLHGTANTTGLHSGFLIQWFPLCPWVFHGFLDGLRCLLGYLSGTWYCGSSSSSWDSFFLYIGYN